MAGTRRILGCGLLWAALMATGFPAFGQPDTTGVGPSILEISPERVAAGDTLVIEGAGFTQEPGPIRVTLDGEEVPRQFFRVVSSAEIRLRVPEDVKGGTERNAGEYDRSVVVWTDRAPSNAGTFVQIGWGVLVQPRVFVPLIIYLVFVLGILFLHGGGMFHSATGNLSLSKIQMGIWALAFSFSYVLLAAVWRDFLPVTPGMLWLLGISSGTAVGAKAIAVKNSPTPAARSRASRLCSEFDPGVGAYRSAIHRCQMLLWTLIVLIVYALKLISTMHLPEIPGVFLVLMGVSGGAYLGFNYPRVILPEVSSRAAESGPRFTRKRRRPRRPSSGSSQGRSD